MRDDEGPKPDETVFRISDNDDVEVFVGGAVPNYHSEEFMDKIGLDDGRRDWQSYHPANRTVPRCYNHYLDPKDRMFSIVNRRYKLYDWCKIRDPEELAYYNKHGEASARVQKAIDADEPIIEYCSDANDDVHYPQKIKL